MATEHLFWPGHNNKVYTYVQAKIDALIYLRKVYVSLWKHFLKNCFTYLISMMCSPVFCAFTITSVIHLIFAEYLLCTSHWSRPPIFLELIICGGAWGRGGSDEEIDNKQIDKSH